MRGLTLQAPWLAGAILAPAERGPKLIENRSFKPPRCIWNQVFALHQGKTFDFEAQQHICNLFGLVLGAHDLQRWKTTGILGLARCVGYIERHPADHSYPWRMARFICESGVITKHTGFPIPEQVRWWRHAPRNVAWILEEVRPLREPIPVRGMQGIWRVHPDVEAQAWRLAA